MDTKTWMGEITAPNNQHTQYVKPTLDIDGYKPIIQDLMWHTSIHGEYASKNQYANEQLQIGGPYTVRGYLKQTMLGNAGIYMRNDLAWILPAQAMKCDGYQFFCEALIQGTELYGIFDVGMTRGVFTYANMPKNRKRRKSCRRWIGYQKNHRNTLLECLRNPHPYNRRASFRKMDCYVQCRHQIIILSNLSTILWVSLRADNVLIIYTLL